MLRLISRSLVWSSVATTEILPHIPPLIPAPGFMVTGTQSAAPSRQAASSVSAPILCCMPARKISAGMANSGVARQWLTWLGWPKARTCNTSAPLPPGSASSSFGRPPEAHAGRARHRRRGRSDRVTGLDWPQSTPTPATTRLRLADRGPQALRAANRARPGRRLRGKQRKAACGAGLKAPPRRFRDRSRPHRWHRTFYAWPLLC